MAWLPLRDSNVFVVDSGVTAELAIRLPHLHSGHENTFGTDSRFVHQSVETVAGRQKGVHNRRDSEHHVSGHPTGHGIRADNEPVVDLSAPDLRQHLPPLAALTVRLVRRTHSHASAAAHQRTDRRANAQTTNGSSLAQRPEDQTDERDSQWYQSAQDVRLGAVVHREDRALQEQRDRQSQVASLSLCRHHFRLQFSAFFRKSSPNIAKLSEQALNKVESRHSHFY